MTDVNNIPINVGVTTDNKDFEKVSAQVDALVKTLENKLTVKVNIGAMNKNIRDLSKGFKEFSNMVKDLKTTFADVEKLTQRAFDSANDTITKLTGKSSNAIATTAKREIEKLKIAESNAKKTLALLKENGAGNEEVKAGYQKHTEAKVKLEEANHFMKGDLSPDAYALFSEKKKLIEDEAAFSLAKYEETEDKKLKLKRNSDAKSDKALDAREKNAELNRLRDITKDKHDAWVYNPSTDNTKEYRDSARELGRMRLGDNFEMEELDRKYSNIDNYIRKREKNTVNAKRKTMLAEEQLEAEHLKNLALVNEQYDDAYLTKLNSISLFKMRQKGINRAGSSFIPNENGTDLLSNEEVANLNNQKKVDDIRKKRQAESIKGIKTEEQLIREEIVEFKKLAKRFDSYDEILLASMNKADALKSKRITGTDDLTKLDAQTDFLKGKEASNAMEVSEIKKKRTSGNIALLKEEIALTNEKINLTKKEILANASGGKYSDTESLQKLLRFKNGQEKTLREMQGNPVTSDESLQRKTAVANEVDSFNKKLRKAENSHYKEQNQLKFEQLKTNQKNASEQASIDLAGVEAYRRTTKELAVEIANRKGLTGSDKKQFIDQQNANIDVSANKKKFKLEEKLRDNASKSLADYYAKELRYQNDANRNRQKANEEAYRKERIHQMKMEELRKNPNLDKDQVAGLERGFNKAIDVEIEKAKAKNAKSDDLLNRAEIENSTNLSAQELKSRKDYWEKVGYTDRNYRKLRIDAARNEAKIMADQMGLNNSQSLKLQKQYINEIETEYKKAMGHGSSYAQTMMAKIRGLLVFTGFYFVAKQAIIAVASAGVEFNDTMAGVRAVTGATAEEFDRLKESARGLATETRYTSNEVAQLQDIYAKLGLSVKAIIQASQPTLDLATATGENLAETAESVAVTLNGFQMSAEETGRVTDVMAQSFVESALDLERYREGMKLAAPVANALGMSMEQTTSIFAKLANIGISGSMAGTGIRNVLTQASSSSSKLSKVLGGTANTWEEFIELLKVANRRGEEFKQTALSDLDLRIKGVVVALAENVDELDKVALGYENASGAAKRMADIKLDTTAGDLDVLGNVFNEEKLQLFDDTEESLRSIIQTVTDLTKYMSELTKVAFDVGQGFLAMATIIGAYKTIVVVNGWVTTLSASIKSLTQAQTANQLGNMAMVDGQRVFQNATNASVIATTRFGAVVKGTTSLLKGLMLTMAANPLLWGTVAIGGAIAAMNYFSEAEERAVKKSRELNNELTKYLTESAEKTQSGITLFEKYLKLRNTPTELKGEEDSLERKREIILLERINKEYPELKGNVDEITKAYERLRLELKEVNRALDDAAMFKLEIDTNDARIELQKVKNDWTDYLEYAVKQFTPVQFFTSGVDLSENKELRDGSDMSARMQKMVNSPNEIKDSDISYVSNVLKTQLDLAKAKENNINLSKSERADWAEEKANIIQKITMLERLRAYNDRTKSDKTKTGAYEILEARGTSGKSESEAIKKEIAEINSLEERIKTFSGNKQQLAIYKKQLEDLKADMFNIDPKDGKSRMDLVLDIGEITAIESDNVKDKIAKNQSEIAYFMREHYLASDEEITNKMALQDKYIDYVRSEARGLFISQEKYDKLSGDSQRDLNILTMDLLNIKNKTIEQALNMSFKNEDTKQRWITDRYKEECQKRIAVTKNLVVSAGDILAKLPELMNTRFASISDEPDNYERARFEEISKRRDDHIGYMETTGKDRVGEDGPLTKTYKDLKYKQLYEQLTAKYKNLGELDPNADILIPENLKYANYQKKIKEMVEAELRRLEKSKGGKKADKSEQLMPDLISIRKKINEFAKSEESKELAELENFYSQKVALVSQGETEAYAKRTEIDKKTSRDLYKRITESANGEAQIEAMKQSALKTYEDRIGNTGKEIEVNNRPIGDLDERGIKRTDSEKGRLNALQASNNEVLLREKASFEKAYTDLVKQGNTDRKSQTFADFVAAIFELTSYENQRLTTEQKYADMRKKSILDARSALSDNEAGKKIYAIEKELAEKRKELEPKGDGGDGDRATLLSLAEQKRDKEILDLRKSMAKELMTLNGEVLGSAISGYEEERKQLRFKYDDMLISARDYHKSLETINLKQESSEAEASGNKYEIETYKRLTELRTMTESARNESIKERTKSIMTEFETEKANHVEKLMMINAEYKARAMFEVEKSFNNSEPVRRTNFNIQYEKEKYDSVSSNPESTDDDKVKALEAYNKVRIDGENNLLFLKKENFFVSQQIAELMSSNATDVQFERTITLLMEQKKITVEAYEALAKLRGLQGKEVRNAKDIKIKGTLGDLTSSYEEAGQAFDTYTKARNDGSDQQYEASNNALMAYGKAAGDTIDIAAGMYSSIRTLGEADTQNQLDKVARDKEANLTALDDQLEKGVWSKSQYEAKKKAINERALEEERKIKKKQKVWAEIQIVIDTAAGIAKAFAQGGTLGFVTGALIAAAGAAQLKAVQGQKFAKGGFTGPGSSYRDETGKRVAGVVHQNEVVFEDSIALPNLSGLMEVRRLLQSGIKLRDIVNPKINLSRMPTLPNLPQHVFATGGFTGNNTLIQAGLTSDIAKRLIDVAEAISIMNSNLIEKKMTVNVTAKTIDPVDVHDLAEEGKKSKGYLYDK